MDSISLQHLSVLMGISRAALHKRSTKEEWPFETKPARGGKQNLYFVNNLPADIRAVVIAKSEIEDPVNLVASVVNDMAKKESCLKPKNTR